LVTLEKSINLRRLQQSIFLGLWSFLCVLPLLWKTGPNVVTLTYLEGSQRLYQGINPYLPSEIGADLFFYPPFFAAFWKLFAIWGDQAGILIWSFINSFVFWWGVSQWFEIKRNQSKWAWFFLIATAIELDISLRYQQANALLAGLILWGLSELRSEKKIRAAFILAFSTHLKVFPVLVAILVALPKNTLFAFSYLGALGLFFIWPAFLVGFQRAIEMHWVQLFSTTADFDKRELLDLATCLKRLHLTQVGVVLSRLVLVVGGGVLAWYRFLTPNRKFNWTLWYSSFMAYLLVIVPKAESPTFVWVAQAYLFVMAQVGPRLKWLLATLALSLTLVYSSLFPRPWVEWMTWEYTSKTLANFALWGFASWLLVREKVK